MLLLATSIVSTFSNPHLSPDSGKFGEHSKSYMKCPSNEMLPPTQVRTASQDRSCRDHQCSWSVWRWICIGTNLLHGGFTTYSTYYIVMREPNLSSSMIEITQLCGISTWACLEEVEVGVGFPFDAIWAEPWHCEKHNHPKWFGYCRREPMLE